MSGHAPTLAECVRRARRVGCLALIVAVAQPASAQRPALEFRDIAAIRGAGIATRTPVGLPPVVREPQSRPTGSASPDPSLGAPVARLALDAGGWLAAAALPVGEVVGAGSPLIELELADHVFAMAVIERVMDVAFEAAHYTLVSPGSRDYARITVSRVGPEVVGTVFLGGSEYRILPAEDGHQLVFPVVLHGGEFRRERPPPLDTRSERLEARHLQLAWFSEHRPEAFRTEPDGRLELYRAAAARGGSLGRIDISRAMQVDAAGNVTADFERLAEAVALFLNDTRHRTLIDAPVQVIIETADLRKLYEGSAARTQIRFQQAIDGVPVDDDNYVEIDSTGNVLVLSSDLMQPSNAERKGGNLLTADEAESIARAAVIERHAVDWPLQARERELIYEYADEFTRLALLWKVVLGNSACELRYDVYVGASSGEIADLDEALDVIRLLPPPGDDVRARCRGGQPR